MSRELKEFSDMIDEQFEPIEIADDEFWNMLLRFFGNSVAEPMREAA